MNINGKTEYDLLIVGAGLYGATVAYLAKEAGFKCLVIDKRPTVGGNLYCENVEGIPVHKYGAHIFHTDNKMVWDFVSSKCDMTPFVNSPIARYHDETYNLPFNMNTFSKLFGVVTPEEAKARIEREVREAGINDPKNLEEQAISLVGKTIYTKLIKEYTEKQWGRDCKDLDPSIIKRLPVRYTYDNNYFNDKYQGIPRGGYNSLIDSLLVGVEVRLNEKYDAEKYEDVASLTIYTGPIDEYFGYKHGELEWRTVKFDTTLEDCQNYQGNAVVNYTSHDEEYTRIIEHKHFDRYCDGYLSGKTVISKEYSSEWHPGIEPFYPVNSSKNAETLSKYLEEAKECKTVFFGGRLGNYKYYDMDDTIEKAMSDFDTIRLIVRNCQFTDRMISMLW